MNPPTASGAGQPGLLSRVGAFLLVLTGAVGAGAEARAAGWAPVELKGMQFQLEGISSEGIPESLTLLFRNPRAFDATRTLAAEDPRDHSGSYAYQRTGPDTATLTTTSADPAQGACTTLLLFTSATAGAYTGWCPAGASRTGQFQLEVEDPFCLSLWDGLPCATVAILPRVSLGRLAESTVTTEVVLANGDPNPGACEVALLFHQGLSEGPAIRFNGQTGERNLFQATLPREGAESVVLSLPQAQDLLTGAVHVYARSPCTDASLHVQGRSLIENRNSGDIEELVPLAGQSPRDWLGDGDCRVLTGVFGDGRQLSLASATTRPGSAAPAGATLRLRTFDLSGRPAAAPPSLAVSGAVQSSQPWAFDQPRIVEMCLEIPGTSLFRTALAAFGSKTTRHKRQVSAERFADAYRLGDPTPWSATAP